MKAYSVILHTDWAGEDEGFRFPLFDHMFKSLKKAETALRGEERDEREVGPNLVPTESEELVEYTSVPNTQGTCVGLYSFEYGEVVTSLEEAAQKLDGGLESLYSYDWAFIMEIEVL